jgi:hypothetical protein
MRGLKQTTSIDVFNTKYLYDYFIVNIGKMSNVTSIFNDLQYNCRALLMFSNKYVNNQLQYE